MKTKVLLFALLAQLFTLSASAYDAIVNGICYNLDTSNKTASVTYKTSGNSYSGSITIPTNITYNNVSYKVTSIGSMAFDRCEDLTSVYIPSSITSIENAAFAECTGLRSFNIPASVTELGVNVFSGCSSLSTINIPSSVTFIEYRAFNGTPWYDSWLNSQPDGPCYINSVLYTYKGKENMPPSTSVVVKDGTTCIAGEAFMDCANLTSIEIPQSVTSICSLAFCKCGFKTISLPTSLTYLGANAFYLCEELTEIEIPAFTKGGGRSKYPYGGNFSVPVGICVRCTNLSSAKLAEGTTIVYANTFYGCTNLTTVTLPSTITNIASNAFRECNNLSTVKVGMRTPIAIDSEVFTNRFLATLIVPEGCKEAYQNAEYWQDFKEIKEENDMQDGEVFTALAEEGVEMKFMVTSATDKTCIVTGGLDEDGLVGLPAINTQYAGQITIPSEAKGFKVTNIGFGAFMDCENLTSVHISEGIEIIEPYAFHYCRKLESVSLPESLRQIQREAFEGCTSLNSIVIPKNVCELGENDEFELGHCLQNTPSLSSIVVDEANAYYDSRDNCNAVISKATNTLVIGCKNTVIPNGITSIGEYAFEYCENLTSINIPVSVKSIQKYAFNGCKSLTSITIPKKVSSLSKNFIFSCDKLTEIYSMIENPFAIGNDVFYYQWQNEDRYYREATLYVPKGKKTLYENAEGWKNFQNIVELDGPEPDTDTDISLLDNVIYLEKTEGFVGTTATLSLKMKNTAAIRGFQFDLYLPEGVTAVKNNKGRIQASLSSGRLPEDDEHTLTLSEQADGAIRFLCGSQYDETFTGNDGEIATLQVTIAEDMEDGDYPILLKDMRLSETDISKYYDTERVKSTLTISSYILGDINGDQVINVSDYIGIANYILGSTPAGFIEKAADVNEDKTVNVSDYIGVANIILTGSPYGNSNNAKPAYLRAKSTDLSTMDNVIYVKSKNIEAGTLDTLSFMMKNTAAIRGFQFDLYLPDGVTVVKNNKGRIQGSLSEGRLPEDDEHTLTISEQADGAIRFLCGSQYDETFTGNEGEIATLQVNIAEGLARGEYPVVLKNMRLSETDISKFYDSDNVETVLMIIATGIADHIGDSDTPAVIYNLAGQRLAKPQHGVNIVNGKKIVVK